MADRRLRAILAATAVVLAGLPIGPAPAVQPVVADGPAATVLVLDGRVWAPPDDAVWAGGTPSSVNTSWTSSTTDWTTVGFTGPDGAALAPGQYTIGPGGAGLTYRTGYCSSGLLTILEGPVFTDSVLTAFAADWTGCGIGSLRISSSVPTPALRPDAAELSYSSVPFGSSASQTLTVRNVGNMELAVGAPSSLPRDGFAGAADFSVTESTCGSTLAVGDACVLTVGFAPSDEGPRGGILSVSDTPGTLGATTLLQGSGAYGPAPNDRIADAVTIPSLPFVSRLMVENATTDRLDPVCGGSYQRTVWYRYTPLTDGRLSLSTAGSWGSWDRPVDTVVGIYSGSAPDDLALVGCSDDVATDDRTSLLRLAVEGGTDYWIAAGAGQQGTVLGLRLTATVAAPDTSAAASGWVASPTTFYPYPDGYRDTTSTVATLDEPAWVVVDVFPSGSPGSIVRTAELGLREQGYAWRWDGRTAGGARVPAGVYVLRHRVTDLFGNVVTHNVSVTLSNKKLAWSTASRTLDGSRYWQRAVGSSTARATVDGRTIILKSGDEWAQVAYRFSVVDATVYGNIRFEVVGRSTNGRKARIMLWDSQEGKWSGGISIGPGSGTWKTSWTTAWDHLYKRYAYGLVEVQYSAGKVNWVIEKARVTYTYAVLE